jgi:hypothetical protein
MNRREAVRLLGAAAISTTLPANVSADHGRTETTSGPLTGFHAYLCAYHLAKRDPALVVEAHHYCAAIKNDVHQCVIFDSNGKNARILGVEYIVSDAIYHSLPEAEKKFYHPHRYEVIGGLLLAPGLGADDEKTLMDNLVTTWGKTWHTWPDPKNTLPIGEPLLMWSATRDGQIDAGLLKHRDRELHIDSKAIRRRRSHLGPVPDVPPPKSIDEVGKQQ